MRTNPPVRQNRGELSWTRAARRAAIDPVEASAALQAVSITKQRAEALALQAVGGGTAVLAVLERENGFIHWTIDIVDAVLDTISVRHWRSN